MKVTIYLSVPCKCCGNNSFRQSASIGNRLRFRIQFVLRPERFPKGVGKIVAVLKIVAAVLVGLGEQADLHHVENDVAEVAAVFHAPFLEHGHGHGAELLERKLPDAVEQLLPGDVADAPAALLADEFLGEVERLAHESLGVARVARVLRHDLLHGFVEIDFVHFKVWLLDSLSPDSRCDMFSPPSPSATIPERQSETTAPV